jgi:hypothetical protein
MKILKKFEENLEYLGFDLAPVAWDIAKMKFASDDDRLALLEELTTTKEAEPVVNDGMVE